MSRIDTAVLVAAAATLRRSGDPNGILPLILDLLDARRELEQMRAASVMPPASMNGHGGRTHDSAGET